MKKLTIVTILVTTFFLQQSKAQNGDPKATETWEPVPKIVNTGAVNAAPSDAIVLFDGKNLNEWVSVNDTTKAALWTVSKRAFTIKKGTGNI